MKSYEKKRSPVLIDVGKTRFRLEATKWKLYLCICYSMYNKALRSLLVKVLRKQFFIWIDIILPEVSGLEWKEVDFVWRRYLPASRHKPGFSLDRLALKFECFIEIIKK